MIFVLLGKLTKRAGLKFRATGFYLANSLTLETTKLLA